MVVLRSDGDVVVAVTRPSSRLRGESQDAFRYLPQLSIVVYELHVVRKGVGNEVGLVIVELHIVYIVGLAAALVFHHHQALRGVKVDGVTSQRAFDPGVGAYFRNGVLDVIVAIAVFHIGPNGSIHGGLHGHAKWSLVEGRRRVVGVVDERTLRSVTDDGRAALLQPCGLGAVQWRRGPEARRAAG